MKALRVGVLGIQHESNTFVSAKTGLEDFQSAILAVGDGVRERYADAHHEIGGFFEGLREAGIVAVPLVAAFALPAGEVTDPALDALWAAVRERMAAAGPLDGVLAAPHGAAVNTSRRDMDGWWLGQLRRLIGPETPLIAVIDSHANLSVEMAAACDALIAYRENPHLDQRERGIEAARLMARTLRGEVRPVVAAAFPSLVIPMDCQGTDSEPMQSVARELERVRAQEGVLSASVAMGYPYADVPEMGTSFVVVTDGDCARGHHLADQLGQWLAAGRERFCGELIEPSDAVRMAASLSGPVALLDMGDNMGGGAPADSTVLARLCSRLAPQRNTFVCLHDPEGVRSAAAAGVGAFLRIQVGGRAPESPAEPLPIAAEVLSLHEGKYRENRPRHGGMADFDMGPTAILRAQGLTVMLTTRRGIPTSLKQLDSCGLSPHDFDIIILKGVHAPVAAYREVCPAMIRVNTPGVTAADLSRFAYTWRRRPLFPFEN